MGEKVMMLLAVFVPLFLQAVVYRVSAISSFRIGLVYHNLSIYRKLPSWVSMFLDIRYWRWNEKYLWSQRIITMGTTPADDHISNLQIITAEPREIVGRVIQVTLMDEQCNHRIDVSGTMNSHRRLLAGQVVGITFGEIEARGRVISETTRYPERIQFIEVSIITGERQNVVVQENIKPSQKSVEWMERWCRKK